GSAGLSAQRLEADAHCLPASAPKASGQVTDTRRVVGGNSVATARSCPTASVLSSQGEESTAGKLPLPELFSESVSQGGASVLASRVAYGFQGLVRNLVPPRLDLWTTEIVCRTSPRR